MVLGRIDAHEPIEVALRRVAQEFAGFVLSPGALEMFRTCIAESGRFPELGRAFYASGPGRLRTQLIAFLDSAVLQGDLVIGDTALAADQFAALCKARVFVWSLLGCDKPPSEAEIATLADEAVRTFLARYGAPAAAEAARRGRAAVPKADG